MQPSIAGSLAVIVLRTMKLNILFSVILFLIIGCSTNKSDWKAIKCIELRRDAKATIEEAFQIAKINFDTISFNNPHPFCVNIDGEVFQHATYLFKPSSNLLPVGELPKPCNCSWIKLSGEKVMVDNIIFNIKTINWEESLKKRKCFCIEIRETSEKYGELLWSLNKSLIQLKNVDSIKNSNLYFVFENEDKLYLPKVH